MSLLETVLPFLNNQAASFISCGIGRSYFCENFCLSFILWYDLKILVKSMERRTFLCLASSINVRQKFFFNWKLHLPSFILLIWTEKIWIWFSRKLTKNIEISIAFKFFLILTTLWLSNLTSDFSSDNTVRLSLADTKISSQDPVKTMLELTEKRKYPNFRSKF